MKQYLELVKLVLETGTLQENRTGIRTISLPGSMMRFDLTKGFPALTTKKLAFKTAVAELIGFLRPFNNAADFRSLGCKVWDQNANENTQWLGNPYRIGGDDLGEIYGVQWRKWPAYKILKRSDSNQIKDAVSRGYKVLLTFSEDGIDNVLMYAAIDQLRQCLDTIINNPSDRRIIFHAWNPAQLEQMALPPCHLLYQFLPSVANKEISMCLYIRSNDLGLGAPFNIAEAAVLLTIVGRLTGYTPKWLTYFIGDTHIYENHKDMLYQQLEREPLPSPRIVISDRVPEFIKTGIYEPDWLDRLEPSDFSLDGYLHHPAITAPMAV